ncbi:hypothetical protein GJ496_006526 [Pomphorhynchus laevis]|nr:hypothetical protein GJ496_006526 [Pomphorhynchus laevis]
MLVIRRSLQRMTSRIPRPVNSMNLVTRSQRTSRATSIASDDDDEVYKTIAAGSARNISLGEQVHIPGGKTGVLRYRGMTQFKQGEWAGIELDYCSGLNDGSVNEVRYFSCPPGYGIFVPIHKVKRLNPSGNINRYTNSRPCSTTPSISSRSSLKSKSITNSPTSLSAAINSIGHHPNRKTRRYTGEKYQTEALSPKSLSIGDSVNGYSPSVISDQNVSMINILMLERDKAIGTIEKLKQRVEDLEFELEEEKARRTAEELKSTLNAAVQANIQDSTVNELQLQLKNLSVQHNTLLSSVQSYDLSIEVLTNLCDQMDIKHQITMPNKSLSKICDAIAEQFEHKKIALQKAEDNNSDLRCEIEELQMIQKQSEYDFNLQMCKLEDRLQAEIIDLKDNVIANLKSDLEHKTKLVEDQENKLMELEDKLKVNLNANLKFAYDVELSSLENGKEHDITDSTKCDFNKTNCPYQADSNDPSNVAQVESDINNSQLNGQKGGGDLSSNYLSVEGVNFPLMGSISAKTV